MLTLLQSFFCCRLLQVSTEKNFVNVFLNKRTFPLQILCLPSIYIIYLTLKQRLQLNEKEKYVFQAKIIYLTTYIVNDARCKIKERCSFFYHLTKRII